MSRFITIDFSAIDNILTEFQGISDRASDLKPVAGLVALVISSYTDDVFANAPRTESGGTAFNGFVWDRLSEPTLNAENGRRRNGQIMRKTGALLNSLQSNSTTTFSPRSAANFFQAGSDRIEFGTNLPQGFNNNKRPFLAHTDSLSELVEKAIENYILTGET